jgi:hypothetical protein
MHREQCGSTSLEILGRDLIPAMQASGDVDSGQGALRAAPLILLRVEQKSTSTDSDSNG